jgi:predicted GNAT family N-acyltransferase
MKAITKNIEAKTGRDFDSSTFQVRIASSDKELDQIYQLRYKICIEEMNGTESYANHGDKTIIEPLDKTGVNIGVWLKDDLVGCVRINLGRNSDISNFARYNRMDLVEGFSMEKTSICTKLMVDRHYRNTRVNILLMQACYRFAMEHGTETGVIESSDQLLKYYARFGFKPYTGKIRSEYYGDHTPLVLHLLDIDHLIAVRSPMLTIYYEVKSPSLPQV